MNIWGFLLGFILGIFPLILVLKFFRGKILFIHNIYVKGALFGFLLWAIINVLIFFEVRYNLIGLAETEEGYSTIALFAYSLQGFLTAGLAAAFFSTHMRKDKKPKT